MGEHVDGLYLLYAVLLVQQLQVAGLGGRVDVRVHAGPWRVGDNDVRTSVLGDKLVRQDVFHVAGKEQCVLNAVDLGVDLGVLDGFGHILDADDLPCLSCHEVGDGPRAGIQVLNQRLIVFKVFKVLRVLKVVKVCKRKLPCY